MGIATPQPPSDSFLSRSKLQYSIPVSKTTPTADNLNSLTSMSQGFHQGIISFSNGFERSTTYQEQHQQHQQHIAHQSRREKLRVQGFHPHPPLVALEGEEETGDLPAVPVYEAAGMLSEMFNFAPGAATTADLLDQVPSNYRLPRPPAAVANEWYGNRQGFVSGLGSLQDIKSHNSNNHGSEAQHHQISSINADSASAMQLFLMNPQARSPSPSPPASSSSPLHMWLPNPPTPPLPEFHQAESAFASSGIPPAQFSWVPGSGSGGNNASKIGGIVESQGLSLSLSSSLQHLEAAKAEELRMRDGGVYFYNQGGEPSSPSYPLKNLGTHNQALRLHGGLSQNQQFHVGFGSSVGMVNVLRNSKYVKAAQELLEEFCSVGRGHLKKNRLGNTNPNSNPRGGGAGSSSPSKNPTPLSSADRIEYQRRKVKLISMLDEVDRRYNHYCEQMEMVVNSFDSVMGFGAATPYTALAKKAMSRHFRCLKDAIVCQLKLTCDLLGDKEGTGGSGVTKGETPRLRMLEQSLRQQRAFHQMGMMEQEAWRPQRGLPERSVNILRAWLFEHFLHPYPSDADKHLLARQTGLSRNQVSNWFINARVRLWKPMVEEMYQQEAKDEATDDRETDKNQQAHSSTSAQTPKLTTPETAAVASTSTTAATAAGKRSEFNAHDSDPSHIAINRHRFSESQAQQPISAGATTAMPTTTSAAAAGQVTVLPSVNQRFPTTHESDVNNRLEISDPFQNGSIVPADYGNAGANANLGSTILRFGTTTGDVSLTLGLRHAGNFRDFGGC